MVRELSVKGNREFEDLIRALKWSSEFAIYFAVVNPPVIRKQTAEALKKRLDKEKITVHSLELDRSYFDVLSVISENVPSYCLRGAPTKTHAVLFICDTEESIASDAGTRRSFFDSLNWQRDKLRETIACPLVIWLPEFAVRILAVEAPDFWAWRSGVYYLGPAPAVIFRDTKELLRRETSEYDVLTRQEKERRLDQFKALLADYDKNQFGEGLESEELLNVRFYVLQEAGNILLSLGDYKEAKRYFLLALQMAERLKDKGLLAQIFRNLAIVSVAQGDYTSTEEYTENVSEIAEESEDKEESASAFLFLGMLAAARGKYNKAEDFLRKSLEIGQEGGNKELTALALISLGSASKDRGNYTEARRFLEQSRRINEERGDKGGIVDNLIELSDLAKSQGDMDEALREIDHALTLSKEIKDRGRIARVLELYASLLVAHGDYPRAQDYYRTSLELYEQLGDKRGIESLYSDLGKIAEDQGTAALKIFERIRDSNQIEWGHNGAEPTSAGVQVASSIITITNAISDFLEGRVSANEREGRLRAMKQEVDTLRYNIPLMFRENEKLAGYTNLRNDAQELFIVGGKLDTLIRNAHEDKSRALLHIEDLHVCMMREAHPVMDSVMYIVEQEYPFLKDDGVVTRRLYSIRDMFDDMHSRIKLAWINKTTELDKNMEVKEYLYGILGNLASLMRYLDNRIKELSEKMKEESEAFENLLNEPRR